MNRTTLRSVVVALALTGCLTATSGTAHAADPYTEANQVADTIADVSPVDIVIPELSDTGDLVATSEHGTVDIPADPSAPVVLSASDELAAELKDVDGIYVEQAPDIAISLPDLSGITDAELAEDGTITYPSGEDTTVAVQPLDDGARFLTVIDAPAAPTTFDYGLDLPEGSTLTPREDGSVEAVTSDGQIIATIDTPWAFDANGHAVPTHYRINDTTLTQVVDHTSNNYAYPITADPKYTHTWWNQTLYFNKSETSKIASWQVSAASLATGFIPVPLVKALSVASGALNVVASAARSKNKCMKVVMYTGGVVVPQIYSGSEAGGYCR